MLVTRLCPVKGCVWRSRKTLGAEDSLRLRFEYDGGLGIR